MQYDKMRDMILQGYENKKSKQQDILSSLVSNLEKVKFNELVLLAHHFDSKTVLDTPVKGWKPLHYACMNSDPRVINFICELMVKHHVNLDLSILQTKKCNMIGSGALDIACVNKNISNAIVLCSYDSKGIDLQQWGLRLLKGAYYKHDEQKKSKTTQPSPEPQNFSFPHPDNLLTRAMLHQKLPDFLKFFDNYNLNEEISELKDNLKSLFKHFFSEKYFLQYSHGFKNNPLYELLYHMEKVAEDIQKNENSIKNHYLDLFMIPFTELIYSNNVDALNAKGQNTIGLIVKLCPSSNRSKNSLNEMKFFSQLTSEMTDDFYETFQYFEAQYGNIDLGQIKQVQQFFNQFKSYFLYKKIDMQIGSQVEQIEDSIDRHNSGFKI
jgi:hypothetical protein